MRVVTGDWNINITDRSIEEICIDGKVYEKYIYLFNEIYTQDGRIVSAYHRGKSSRYCYRAGINEDYYAIERLDDILREFYRNYREAFDLIYKSLKKDTIEYGVAAKITGDIRSPYQQQPYETTDDDINCEGVKKLIISYVDNNKK